LIETNTCDGLKIKEKVDFEVEITLTKCLTDMEKFKRVVNIVAAGINERITVNLDPICNCDCEKEDQLTVRRILKKKTFF
jgi:protocadherin alpha